MNLDNLRLNSTHNPENNLIILIIIDEISDAFFTCDENKRKLVSYLSEKVVLRTSETSAIEQP